MASIYDLILLNPPSDNPKMIEMSSIIHLSISSDMSTERHMKSKVKQDFPTNERRKKKC